MKSSVVLSVSSPELSCTKLASKLVKCGINCDITENLTLVEGVVETGCRITFTATSDSQVKEIWEAARSEGRIKCGHISVPGRYSGCTMDYPFKSRCPGGTIPSNKSSLA